MTADDESGSTPPPERPGARTFTIEGRAAPGLFLVGWLATIMGLGISLVGALASNALLVYVVGFGLVAGGLIAGAGSQALERRARGAAYAGPSPVLLFGAGVAATLFVTAVALFGLAGLSRVTGLAISESTARVIAVALTGAVLVGLVHLAVVGTGALSWREMGVRRLDRQAVVDLAWGGALAVPVLGLTSIVAWLLVGALGVIPESPLPPTREVGSAVLQLLVGALVAPVAEELFYRGFALTAWRRTHGAGRAIVRASILFLVAHVLGVQAESLPEAAGLVAFGIGSRVPVALVLGWLFVERRSIWAPIGLHATFNGIPLLVAVAAAASGRPLPTL